VSLLDLFRLDGRVTVVAGSGQGSQNILAAGGRTQRTYHYTPGINGGDKP